LDERNILAGPHQLRGANHRDRRELGDQILKIANLS
jgi:hypothetical protein